MIRSLLTLLLTFAVALCASAQTKTTQALDEKYDGLSLYFYKNTLRMLNQSDSKEFDDMIRDIEKMRFLLIDNADLTKDEIKKIKAGYKGESYEEMMTSRFEGRNFDIYVRESGGNVKGTVILASDSSQLIVLDILGKVAFDKVGTLFKTLDNNSDIGKKVKEFMGHDNE